MESALQGAQLKALEATQALSLAHRSLASPQSEETWSRGLLPISVFLLLWAPSSFPRIPLPHQQVPGGPLCKGCGLCSSLCFVPLPLSLHLAEYSSTSWRAPWGGQVPTNLLLLCLLEGKGI